MEEETIDFENPYDDIDKLFGNPFDSYYSEVLTDYTKTSSISVNANAIMPCISDEFLNLDSSRDDDDIGHNENTDNVDEQSSNISYNRSLLISPTMNDSSLTSTSCGQNNDKFSLSVSSLRSSPVPSTSTGLMESNINNNISSDKRALYLLNIDGTLSKIPMLPPSPILPSPPLSLTSSPSPPILPNPSNSIIYQDFLLSNNQNDHNYNKDHVKLQNSAVLPQSTNKNSNNLQLTLHNLQQNQKLSIKKVLLPLNQYKALTVKNQQNPLKTVIKPCVLKPKLISTAINKKCHSPDKKIKSAPSLNRINDNQIGDSNGNGNGNNRVNCNAIKNNLLESKFVSDDVYKKQQRLIRNRESAVLSRKRKREYVSNLEREVTEISKENSQLRTENTNLRNELTNIKQQCQCNSVNSQSLFSQEQLGQQHRLQLTFNKSLKERFGISSNMRKNATVLLAMVLMISFNVGGLLPTISQNQNQLELEKYDKVGQLSLQRRSVLSSKLSSSDDAAEISASLFDGHFGRSLLWTNEDDNLYNDIGNSNSNDKDNKKNSSLSSPLSLVGCSSFINQTENMRLASELRKWIEINGIHQNITNDYENHNEENKFIGPKSLPSIVLSFNSKYLKKEYNNGYSNGRNSKITTKPTSVKRKFQSNPYNTTHSAKSPTKKGFYYYRRHQKSKSSINDNKNHDYHNDKSHHHSQQPYNHHYLKLLKRIQRKDDTFYVLSFNSDHVLLPASEYNKTSRPKIALMFPAAALSGSKATELNENDNNNKNGNTNNKMILMQIDCEVMNTTMLEFNDYVTTSGNNENVGNGKSSKRNSNKRLNIIKSNSVEMSSSVQSPPLKIAKNLIGRNKNNKSILISKFSDANITAASATNNITTFSYNISNNNNTRSKNLSSTSIGDHIGNEVDFIIQKNQLNMYKPSSSLLTPPPFFLNKNPYYERTNKRAMVTNRNLFPLT